MYSLEGQFTHKFEFTKTYIPSHVKIIGIGHSIGGKVWSELLKKIKLHEDKQKLPEIAKCFMLFPTLERIRVTPNGKWFSSLLPFYAFAEPFLNLVMMLPTGLHRLFLQIYFWGQAPSAITEASLHLFKPDVFQNVFHMARGEMESVFDLDVETLEHNLEKIFFYFGTSDGWVPLEHVEEMKTKLPKMNFKVCDKGVDHAFVIKHSELMAQTICSLIDINNL